MTGYTIVRTESQIEELLGLCIDSEVEGSKYPGEPFERGILSAIRWLTNEDAEHPLLEEED